MRPEQGIEHGMSPQKTRKDIASWLPIPERPPVESLDELFTKGRDAAWELVTPMADVVIERLKTHVLPLLIEGPREAAVASILRDTDFCKKKFRIHQFSDLDALRHRTPEVWKGLIQFSSLYQEVEHTVMRSWVDSMEDAELAAFGLGKQELLLALEIGQATAPLITQTYLRQMELADLPGGSTKTLFGDIDGADYLYEVRDSDGINRFVPFIEQFDETWPELVSEIARLSEKTASLVRSRNLPDSYVSLAAYLHEIAEVYGLREIDPAIVKSRFARLSDFMHEVADAGCPVIISTLDGSYVCGDAGKVDAELRVGLVTGKTQRLHQEYMPYIRTARRFMGMFQQYLADPSPVSELSFNQLISAGGSNLYWRTQGESSDGVIVCHINTTEEVASVMSVPFLTRIFSPSVAREYATKLPHLFVEELVAHELGHTVLTYYDRFVKERLGEGPAANALEELKAELMGIAIVSDVAGGDKDEQHMKDYMVGVIASCLDYVINRASANGFGTNMYADAGRILLATLLESGSLIRTNGVYEIRDMQKGYDAWQRLLTSLCNLYKDTETTPEKTALFHKSLLEQADREALLTEFLAVARGNS